MLRPTLVLLLALLPGLALADVASTPSSQAPVLAPHHARYRLSLLRSSGPKAPAAVSGMIDYEFSGSTCAGFGTAFRQVTVVDPSEGQSQTSSMTTTSVEDLGSRHFRFATDTADGQDGSQSLLGEAAKEGDTLSIALQRPKPGRSGLDGALFPTEHLQRIIATAKLGQKTFSASLFDGSETGLKIFDTFAVIGDPIAGPSVQDRDFALLSGVKRWPISIGYFERGTASDTPSYVMSFELYENGVTRALKIDYGTFQLGGTLEALDALPLGSCGPGPESRKRHNG